jgi:microcystin degradation protein MlrC
MAREFEGVELVGIESPLWPKTYTGSGWVTTDAFETLVGRMIAGLRAEGPFDGVYLALHGAMAVRGVPRPEAELARRVREVVGPKAPIAATFDLHGNEDDEFLKHADMGFAVKYFPHYDEHLQGERAARMLVRMIRGDYRPARAVKKVPILTATVRMWTGASPWMDLSQRALTWEAREVDVYVNVFFGFPFADVPDVGITVQVMTNGDATRAEEIAKDIANLAWRKREALLTSTKIHSIAEGVALARAAIAKGETPVVLADHSDRSGSAAFLLKEIIAQDLSQAIIATIADAKTTAKLKAAGAKAGEAFDMEIGGLVDESAGEAVRIQGTILNAVERHGQFWVVVRFGRDNVLILSTYLVQLMEPFSLAALGLDIHAFKAFAISRAFISAKALTTMALPKQFCWSSRISRCLAPSISTRCPMRTSTSNSSIHMGSRRSRAELEFAMTKIKLEHRHVAVVWGGRDGRGNHHRVARPQLPCRALATCACHHGELITLSPPRN